ncbi:uncharacterized protein BP01DRAFT_349046 [Aspergillus saccharolyticus JOP 1030-1]|uniref:DUF7730 domain-containing protein n=1 Tax=Aspergillus saccharolyticus JOP 1030-1 TaxID=1450539 RepID=A0A318ZDF4_9EURO|nr:hypothetical protein BP01DRAFT_349046 [Aspergillus saccharolyticus JOP 1030-1]PYH41550.1 hypothetical protein BP01DRAFT_349046 [Aspergillus saccharolyticus JOP 1030-1]
MRHFDAWVLRDPYSIFHYYPTGRRWPETVRSLIQDRQICAPIPTPSTRSTTTPAVFHDIDPQLDSPLFNRLPAEIRIKIWTHVFDAEAPTLIHLVQIRDQIRHVRCPNAVSTAVDKNRRCCPVTAARWRTDQPWSFSSSSVSSSTSKLYPHTHPALPLHLTNAPTSLLRTCRTIYNEASPVLYRTATFDIDDLSTLLAFTDQVNAACLREIRRLQVQVVPLGGMFDDPRTSHSIHAHTHSTVLWTTFWERIATRLTGLDELALCIDLGRFTTTSQGTVVGGYKLPLPSSAEGAEAAWARPILRVRGLKCFELAVTARCDATAAARAGVEREVGGPERLERLRQGIRGVVCSSVRQAGGDGVGQVEVEEEPGLAGDVGYDGSGLRAGWRVPKRRLAICAA